MALHSHFFHKLKRLFLGRRRFAVISLVIVILFLFFLFYRHPTLENEDQYKIGIDNRWKGLQLYGREKNFSAFSNDVLRAISKEEKIRFKLIHIRGNEIESRLSNEELDGIISGIPPTEIRQRTFEFSDPYYVLGPVLTISINTDVEGWNERAKKVIGVHSFSPTILELQKDHGMQLKQYDDIKQALADLAEHKIDGVLFPALPSLIYTQAFYPGRLKVVSPPIDDEGAHLIALKNNRGIELIEHFNRGLEIIKKNGAYDELLKRWDLFNTENLHD
jgi:polar amino acid transport system substrate-binding protein